MIKYFVGYVIYPRYGSPIPNNLIVPYPEEVGAGNLWDFVHHIEYNVLNPNLFEKFVLLSFQKLGE